MQSLRQGLRDRIFIWEVIAGRKNERVEKVKPQAGKTNTECVLKLINGIYNWES